MLKVSDYFDLDSIPIEDLKSQYYDFSNFNNEKIVQNKENYNYKNNIFYILLINRK